MKFKNIISIAVLIFISASCNQYEVFEKEQYKNVFALISGAENVYGQYFDLRRSESTGYISFSMGGTNPTDKDFTINLVEDKSYIDAYNKANYDVEVENYGQVLSASKYDIASLQCVFPAGASGAQIPVRIRPEGLSPDSAYFIAVRVDSYSDYEVNPEKYYLLYKIGIKNYWAKGDGSASYTQSGRRRQDGGSEINIPGSKKLMPLTANSVRMMAGNEVDDSKLVTFARAAITLEIDANNKVKIKPYKSLDVVQIDGDSEYPNVFRIDDDGFRTYKTFLLRYNYTLDGIFYEMKEELRLQFNESDEEII